MPAIVVLPPKPSTVENTEKGGSEGIAEDKEILDLDPLLLALLQKIPNRGESWPIEKRLRWFRTFAMNVSQVYDNDDDPVELRVSVEPQ
jgi:hypothetical protein